MIFEHKIKDLIPIAPIGVAAPLISFIVESHPRFIGADSIGSYATAAFGQDVLQTAVAFQAEVLSQTGAPFNVIQSEGASLYWGGMFDTHRDWQTPHCGHRDGKAMDIRWKALRPEEQDILADLVENSKKIKFYGREAPGTTSDHWHLMPK